MAKNANTAAKKMTRSVILSVAKDLFDNASGKKLNYKGFFVSLRMTKNIRLVSDIFNIQYSVFNIILIP